MFCWSTYSLIVSALRSNTVHILYYCVHDMQTLCLSFHVGCDVRDKGVTVHSGSNWEGVMQLQLISWSETHSFLPFFLFPSHSEELFPCERQRTLQTPPVLSAGQRLVQQAAVDHLSAPGHRALARQDGSDQPVAALPTGRSRPVSHSRAQPQLGHRNGRPYQSLTVGLISRRPWGVSIHLYIDIRENERLSVRDDCA